MFALVCMGMRNPTFCPEATGVSNQMFYELHALIIDHLAHSSAYGYTRAQLEHLTVTQLLDLLCNL